MAKKRRKKSLKGETNSESRVKFLTGIGKKHAKSLREKATDHEKILYKHLKELGYKFEFQVPIITNKQHLYIVDFLLITYNIFLECDGGQHYTKEGLRADNLRSKRLRKEGYEPLRFANKQIVMFTKEQVDSIIKQKIQSLPKINVK